MSTDETRDELAEWFRDERLTPCAHESGVILCCSPCLRDRLLASPWLAARDALIREDALKPVRALVENATRDVIFPKELEAAIRKASE